MSAAASLLLTRPMGDSEALARECKALGIECLISPMLTIEQYAAPLPESADLVIASSRHAFEAITHAPDAIQKAPLYVVGEQTAKAAHKAGFSAPLFIAETMEQLLEHLKQAYAGQSPDALYMRGEDISIHPQTRLPSFHWRECLCYSAVAAAAFSDEAHAALKNSKRLAVAFYSARSAHIFERLLRQTPVNAALEAFCFSSNIAGALTSSLWQQIHVAQNPSTKAMLALLGDKLL